MTTTRRASLDEDMAWAAVLRRDRAADGTFLYAVTSTGVFCRPSCPSRRPRRERVRFFPDASSASAAGFRACRRCRPDAPQSTAAIDRAVTRARELLDSRAGERVALAELARETGVSAAHLQRAFRRIVGLSPREYAEARRTEKLRRELRQEPSVSRAVYGAGFGSGSRVYERSATMLGMTPGAYQRGGEGMVIRYTIVGSRFGRLLVAVTERGVCAVALGDRDQQLERDLHEEFPRASISRVDQGADDWLANLVEGVASRVGEPGVAASSTSIPLDVQGTAFQWRVWQALLEIPAGETRSYQDLARKIGRPRAVRAVAGACAANHVAVLVPCHRVIRGDGTLGGYRWGLPRKARLLEEEAAHP